MKKNDKMKERKNSSNKKKFTENNLSWERYNEWSVLLFQWILSSEEMKWMQKQNEGKIRNTYPSLEPRENVKWSLSNLASTINDAHCGFDRKLINTELKWNNCENDFQIYISNDSKNFNLVFDFVFQNYVVRRIYPEMNLMCRKLWSFGRNWCTFGNQLMGYRLKRAFTLNLIWAQKQ